MSISVLESLYSISPNSLKKDEIRPVPQVTLSTIPKSGTNLILLILKNLGVPLSQNVKKQSLHIRAQLNRNKGKDLKKVFSNKNKYIVSYRDPRDQFISALKWAENSEYLQLIFHFYPNTSQKVCTLYQRWVHLPFTQKLDLALNPNLEKNKPVFFKYHVDKYNYKAVCKLIDLNKPNILMIKFEDLVGPEYGGGSREVQFKTFKRISTFTGANLSDLELKNLMQKTIGVNTPTLTKVNKKVGQWQQVFKPRHVLWFEQYYNKYVMELGYEKRTGWADRYLNSLKDSLKESA